MASSASSAAFLIFHREESGRPTRILSYEEEEATYLLAAANICRELLTHPNGRYAFVQLVKKYREAHDQGWYKKMANEDVVASFVRVIFETFPWIFIDEGFPNPNVQGCHHRRTADKFWTRNQGICLNASAS